jgi:uncharacterized Tic20 family protein
MADSQHRSQQEHGRQRAVIPAGSALPATDVPVPAATRPPGAIERILAACAHLLILASVPGTLIAASIWLTQRRRSPFVAYHAGQAVFWQIMTHIFGVLVILFLLVTAIFSFGSAVNAKGSDDSFAITGLFGSLLGIYVLLAAAGVFFGFGAIFGAIFALFGKGYRYPFIGKKRNPARYGANKE